jgi:hypothetical protein
MRTKSSATGELTRELQDVSPEIVQAIAELMRAMKRGLASPPTQGTAQRQVEKAVAGYKEKAVGFDFGFAPDADYAREVMEVYRSTFPRAPVEQ